MERNQRNQSEVAFPKAEVEISFTLQMTVLYVQDLTISMGKPAWHDKHTSILHHA